MEQMSASFNKITPPFSVRDDVHFVFEPSQLGVRVDQNQSAGATVSNIAFRSCSAFCCHGVRPDLPSWWLTEDPLSPITGSKTPPPTRTTSVPQRSRNEEDVLWDSERLWVQSLPPGSLVHVPLPVSESGLCFNLSAHFPVACRKK